MRYRNPESSGEVWLLLVLGVAYFITCVLGGALVGAFVWLIIVFMMRWPLLIVFLFVGVETFPQFFGLGTVLFACGGAVVGVLVFAYYVWDYYRFSPWWRNLVMRLKNMIRRCKARRA